MLRARWLCWIQISEEWKGDIQGGKGGCGAAHFEHEVGTAGWGASAARSPSARRVGGVAGPSDNDDSGMLNELVYEPCWKATWTYWTSTGGRSGGAVSLSAPEIGSIEEGEAAAGEEEHAAAGGLPILPRMVDGKQRPSSTRAYLEVGKGKVQ